MQRFENCAIDVARVQRNVKLRAQFACRAFCPSEEFDKEWSGATFKALSDIGHDRHRCPAHLIAQAPIPRELPAIRFGVDKTGYLPSSLPNVKLLKPLGPRHHTTLFALQDE
jgi:hypothetical protein